LAQLLVQTAEQAKTAFGQTAQSMDLPVPLARAILLLDEPAPMSALAEILACDRSYVTSLSDQLEERGLVSRVAGGDRRVKLLALTAAGRKVRDKLAAKVAEESVVFRALSDSERKTLTDLLTRLHSEQ
jgi:DNA-binding MarR family transcriptional regulator